MTPEQEKLTPSIEAPAGGDHLDPVSAQVSAETTSSGNGTALSTDNSESRRNLLSAVKGKKLMIIAGDVSADKHVGLVLARLKELAPELEIWGGIGGQCMIEAGVDLTFDLREINAIGLFEVVKHLPRLWTIRGKIIKAIEERKPDVILLVDYGAFNLRIARAIRKTNPRQKIVYFISPQIWASRPWRIKTVVDNISKMLVIFPFEEELYRSRGMNAKFIGHPLTQQIPDESELMSKEAFCQAHGLDPAKPIIAILPGSRKQEIREHLSLCLTSLKSLHRDRPDTQFVISKASKDLDKLFEEICAKNPIDKTVGKNLVFIDGKENYNLLKNSDIVWAKSGTTTLEVAWFGKPMLAFYRGSWFTYAVIVVMKTVRNVSLPNILAGRTLVPELLQLDCRPQQLVRYTRDLLDVPGLRKEYTDQLLELRRSLGQNDYITTCTNELLETLGEPI